MIVEREYNGVDDLLKMQKLVSESISMIGERGYFHVGDVPYHIYNNLRSQPNPDPVAFVRVWENGEGNLIGWVINNPQRKAFDIQIHADYRGCSEESHILDRAEKLTQEMMQQHNINADFIETETYEDDEPYIGTLESAGYIYNRKMWTMGHRSLTAAIPEIELPDGYHFRHLQGIHETQALAEVYCAAFDTTRSADEYKTVLESPGFDLRNIVVVVAPNGRFVAFAIVWFDILNKMALFEPVGTHADFRRKGLGRPLMFYAMNYMLKNGMKTAIVGYSAHKQAVAAFYESVGFKAKYGILVYKKPL